MQKHSNRLLVIKFSAPWCQPCKKYDPVIEKVCGARDDIDYTPVDIEQDPRLAAMLDVRSVPTTIFQSPEGEVLDRVSGPLTAGQLKTILAKHLG